MQIALAQLPGIEGNIEANLDAALSTLERHGDQVSLVVFPETHLSGFAEQDHVDDRALALDGPEVARLIQASRDHDCALAIGLLERAADGVYNTTLLITPEDGIALTYRKTHLWPDERELVGLGQRIGVTRWRGLTLGLMICYDIEFPETARALGALGTDLMLVTNGNMDPYGPVHARAAQARAQDNQCFVAMANRCGEGAGLTFAGHSAAYSPLGETLFEADRDAGVHLVSLDLELLNRARRDYDYLADRRVALKVQRDASIGQVVIVPPGTIQ